MRLHRSVRMLPAAWIALVTIAASPTSAHEPTAYVVAPPTEAQAAEYDLDTAFYTKLATVQGIVIATSAAVSDHAIRETAYQFDMVMRSIAPEAAARVRERKPLCLLIGHAELTSDLPQFATDRTGQSRDFYNWRQRGFLTWRAKRPVVVFAEEDVLEFEGGQQDESILIHELAHVIHGAGFDAQQQQQLTDAFEAAKAAGLWNDGYASQRFRRVTGDEPVSLLDALIAAFPDQSPQLLRQCLDGGDILVNGQPTHADVKVTGDDQVRIVFGGPKRCYALVNRSEYWAEVAQNWYDTNRTMDHDHNHIHTRDQLRTYDPAAARLCEQVLGDTPWRFVSPRTRAGQGHLAGFDPAASPKRENPPHIQKAALDYYDNYWKDFWPRLHEKYPAAAAPAPAQ